MNIKRSILREGVNSIYTTTTRRFFTMERFIDLVLSININPTSASSKDKFTVTSSSSKNVVNLTISSSQNNNNSNNNMDITISSSQQIAKQGTDEVRDEVREEEMSKLKRENMNLNRLVNNPLFQLKPEPIDETNIFFDGW